LGKLQFQNIFSQKVHLQQSYPIKIVKILFLAQDELIPSILPKLQVVEQKSWDSHRT